MADDKSGRDKQARDKDRRQRKHDMAIELERKDESQPPVDETELGEIEGELQPLDFPITAAEVVRVIGDQTVESGDETFRVEELVPATDELVYDSPDALKIRVQRPTIAATMKRILEASNANQNTTIGTSQREAYEKTLRALKVIDADDDDEGIQVIGDWIVEQIQEKKLPASRAVRRKAAKFCRENGYEIRNDEWLGV